jgi:branched-subunit amino acid aminotransferase/4-amino-4-deoxychorismate lyase
MLDAVLRQAQNAISIPSSDEFTDSETKTAKPVQIVRFTWLWSPSRAQLEGKSVCDIVVRAHAVCRGQVVFMPPKVVPITCTIAVDAPQKGEVGTKVSVDPNLPHRFHDPLKKVSSWTRERKAVEKYKPTGVEEVLLVRSLGDTGTGSVELLEGLSSNAFVLYSDNTLHTPKEGVLHGYVRHLVLEAAKSCGLQVSFDAILLEHVGLWKEAFITSSSRLIYPISKLLVPRDGPNNFVDFWKDPSLANDTTEDTAIPKWKELLNEIIRQENSR